MDSAEDIFTQTFGTFTTRFATIFSFRRVAQLGEPAARQQVYDEMNRVAHALFNNPEYDKFFIDKDEAKKIFGGVEGFSEQLVERQIGEFRSAVDAASLVFSHSILDAVALDYLRVTVIESPDSWFQFIAQKQIPISELLRRMSSDIVHEKVSELGNLCKSGYKHGRDIVES